MSKTIDGHRGHLLAFLLVLAALVAPVAATTIIDEELTLYEDTGGTYENRYISTYNAGMLNKIVFYNIENHPDLYYIAISSTRLREVLPDGTHEFTYSGLGYTASGRVSVETYKNILGAVTGHRLIFIFDNWNIGDLIGRQEISLSIDPFKCDFSPTKNNGVVNFGRALSPTATHTLAEVSSITIASTNNWKNHLIVDDNVFGSYNIDLKRVYGDKNYASTIDILNGTTVKFSQGDSNDFKTIYPKNEINKIKITTLGHEFIRLLGSADPGDPSASPVTVYVRDTQTGALLADASPVGTPLIANLDTSAESRRYSEIVYAITDPAGNVEYETYAKSSTDWSTWQYYNKSSWQMEPSSEAAAHNHVWTPTSAGTWTINALIRDRQPPGTGAALASATATCEISPDTSITTTTLGIFVLDPREMLIQGAEIEIRDPDDAVVAVATAPDGYIYIDLSRPAAWQTYRYYVYASAPGYEQLEPGLAVMPMAISPATETVHVRMVAAGTGPADPENTYLMFYVRDTAGNPLPQAWIQCDGEHWVTNNAGHVAVEVPKNATYPYTVSKSGYMSITGTATVGSASSYTVNVVLGTGEIPTLTPTPGPGETPGPGVPTPTPGRLITDADRQHTEGLIIDLIYVFGPLIAILALLGTINYLMGSSGGGGGRGRRRRR